MNFKVLIGIIAVLAIALILWQIVFTLLDNRFLYATLSQTIQGFHRLFIPYFGHKQDYPNYPNGIVTPFKITLYEILIAFSSSAILGVVFGIAIGYFKTIGEAYEPIIYFLYSIPGPILYPVMYLTLGIGVTSRIAIAFYLAIFPPIIVVASGIRRTKQSYVRLAKSYGATSGQIFRKVMIPSSAGAILTGIRLALVFSIIGVIFAEVIASNNGLGSVISIAQGSYDPVIMFAVIVIMVLIVSAILGALHIVERVVMPYSS